jgi:hypothetical protein
MSSTMRLVPLPQIIPPPNIRSNQALLTNISALRACDPKELLALARYFRQKELANDSSAPITTYDPSVPGADQKLVQDATTVFGYIAEHDLMLASVAIDWANCTAVYPSLPNDVDVLLQLVKGSMNRPIDDLKRELLYLRLEIGE